MTKNKTKDDYIKECKKLQEENNTLIEENSEMLNVLDKNKSLLDTIKNTESQIFSLNSRNKGIIKDFTEQKNINIDTQKKLNGNKIEELIVKSDILTLLDKKDEFSNAIVQIDDLIKFKRQTLQMK